MKILLLDIETAPKQAFVWGIWKQNIAPNQLTSDWFMFTWSAKWFSRNDIMGCRLRSSEAKKQDDSHILIPLWDLLNKADVVIGHNGDRFDIPSINTRFLNAGMDPPSPYRTIDTLLVARGRFKFTSNRLDYLGQFLGVGRKIDTGGMELWERCYIGEDSGLKKMLEYNKQDVILLENVYKKLRPYIKNPPSHGTYQTDGRMCCSHCGSGNVQSRGYYHTNVSIFRRFWCKECGGWSRARQNTRAPEHMKNTLIPAR